MQITPANINTNRLYVYLIIFLFSCLVVFIYYKSEAYNIYPLKVEHLIDAGVLRNNAVYKDIDGNGKSEAFYFSRYAKYDVIEWFDDEYHFQDVIKTEGFLFQKNNAYTFADRDNDGYKEIYYLTYRDNTIYLNAHELLGDDGHFIQNFCIEKDGQKVKDEFLVFYGKILEVSEGHSPKLIFSLSAGYGKFPRRLYSFDLLTFELVKAFNSAAYYTFFRFAEESESGQTSILASSSAVENFDRSDSVLFNDNSAWLMHYKADLSDTLFVKEYGENKTQVSAVMLETPGGPFIYNIVKEMRTDACFLEKLSLDGEMIKRVSIAHGQLLLSFLNTMSVEFEQLMIQLDNSVLVYNYNLELVDEYDNVGRIILDRYDSDQEYMDSTGLLISQDITSLTLLNTALETQARLTDDMGSFDRFNNVGLVEFVSEKKFVFYLNSAEETLLFKVSENWFYPWRVPYILLLIAFSYLFFYFVFRAQNYLYNRRVSLLSKVKTLQLQTIQNQLQPHFTFNVLNTIGSMIYQNDKDTAYKYLNHFADMLRSTLLSKSSFDWNLRDELNFVTTYVEMENLRFDGKFEFILDIQSDIDKLLMVPKLTIQAYVENAIRHGLMHKDDNCILWLRITQDAKHIIFVIEDNGIGRDAASKIQRYHVGVGNDILYEYFSIYNRSGSPKFEIEIIDLMELQEAKGTKVIFKIPRNFKSINSE